jgi:peptidoglycan/xylan/chitin deacetylase (PgdA/CDA1 family)
MSVMKKLTLFFLLVFPGMPLVSGQSVDTLYEVGTWKGFSNAAITYTFDDGLPNQFSKVVPMFNEFGFGATFFTVTGWSPDWIALQSAFEQGHEVASHTETHVNFGITDTTHQDIELKNAANAIYAHIGNMKSMTMAYPYCVPGVDSVAALYHFAARGCNQVIEPATPIVLGDQGINQTREINAIADAAFSAGGWAVYLLHAIDSDNGYSPLSSKVLRECLEYNAANPEKFWVGTFGNVVRYIRERNSISVEELESPDDLTILINMADKLEDSIFNYPITIRRVKPENWLYASGAQNNKVIPVKMVLLNTIEYIQFDAVPDEGIVTLKNNLIPPVAFKELNNASDFFTWIEPCAFIFTVPLELALNGRYDKIFQEF